VIILVTNSNEVSPAIEFRNGKLGVGACVDGRRKETDKWRRRERKFKVHAALFPRDGHLTVNNFRVDFDVNWFYL